MTKAKLIEELLTLYHYEILDNDEEEPEVQLDNLSCRELESLLYN